MKTKKVQITAGEVEIKELNFGDENNATRKALEKAILEGKQHIDIVTKREFLLLESILNAPFDLNITSLRELSRNDGLKITHAFNQLNEVMPGESIPSEATSSRGSIQKENLEAGQEK